MSQAAPTRPRPTTTTKAAAAPKTRRIVNIRLLVISLAVAAVGGIAGWVWHHYQSNQVAGTFLQRAAVLEQEGKWPQAANYFAHYLQLEPTDTNARLRLVAAVEKSDPTGPGRYRLVTLLYQTLGELPKRDDLRLKLAQQLLSLQEFAGAKTQANKLLASGDQSTKVAARRILALAATAQARPDGLVSIAEAATALRLALADNSGDPEVASLLANTYRMFPALVGSDATPQHADQIMNALVAANPTDVKSLLARYQYRMRFDAQHASGDLEAALKIEPDNVDALLLSADAVLSTRDASRANAAQQSVLRVIELQAQDPRGYLVAARLRGLAGDLRGAAEILEQGRKKLPTVNLDLEYFLASVLLDLGNADQARAITTEFSKELDRWLPELSTAGRINLENKRRLLHGRLALADGDLPRASREFEAIIASSDEAADSAMSLELIVAHDLLANILNQQRRPDLAAVHWNVIAERVPGYSQSAWKAAKASLDAGNTDVAISKLKDVVQLPGAGPEAWLTLLQAQLQLELIRPLAERNWRPFVETLQATRAKFPDRWEWQFAEVAYRAAQNADTGRKKGLDQLKQIEEQFGQNAEVSERLVVWYQQLNDKASVQRVLDGYDQLQPIKVRRAMLRASVLASQGHMPDALALLEEVGAAATPAEASEIKLARLKLLMAAQQFDQASRLASELIDASPKDRQLLVVGLEIALRLGDYATARRWEDLLKNTSSFDNFEWHYYRARRLIGEFARLDGNDRAELERLVESLRSERPGWLPIITLNAQYAAAQGNRRDAIDAYQSAINAGDLRTETLEQLVRLLYLEGRFEEATKYLSRVEADDRQKARFASLAIVAAAQGNRFAEARDLAKQAIEGGSQDPLHYIWLADLEQTAGDRQSAQEIYRTALQKFPKDARVWQAVFAHFVQTAQRDRARQTLQRWTEQVPMTESQKLLVMGQGSEALGNRQAAVDSYRAATLKDPKDTASRYLLARTLASTDVAGAREVLQQALEIDPAQPDARRLMAVLLSASGDERDWTKAVQYLEAGSDGQSNVAATDDDRLKAILLARKGKNRKERIENFTAARRLLVERLERQPADFSDLDRMLLAGVYEQEALLNDQVGPLQAARDTLRPTVDRANVTADALVSYIQFLLRHVQPPEKSKESAAENDLRRVFAEDARLRIDALEQLFARQPGTDRRLSVAAMRMKLLSAEGRQSDATKLLNEVAGQQLTSAKTDGEKAKVYLEAGNLCTQAGAFTAAENWYRQLEKVAPKTYILVAQSLLQQGKSNDAIELCLQQVDGSPSPEMAAVLAQMLTSGRVSTELNRKAMQVIDSALDAERGNVALLMGVAVLRLTQDNDDEAIRMFRRVVELEPKNTLALNNLATLLAERPEQRGEALKYIERAIESVGRLPALLDTQGTILFHLGRHSEAVAALEEAVSGMDSDPRYYFHLAVAYDGAGRQADAQRALETALADGLDKAMLTKGDRELLASLKHTLLTANNRE